MGGSTAPFSNARTRAQIERLKAEEEARDQGPTFRLSIPDVLSSIPDVLSSGFFNHGPTSQRPPNRNHSRHSPSTVAGHGTSSRSVPDLASHTVSEPPSPSGSDTLAHSLPDLASLSISDVATQFGPDIRNVIDPVVSDSPSPSISDVPSSCIPDALAQSIANLSDIPPSSTPYAGPQVVPDTPSISILENLTPLVPEARTVPIRNALALSTPSRWAAGILSEATSALPSPVDDGSAELRWVGQEFIFFCDIPLSLTVHPLENGPETRSKHTPTRPIAGGPAFNVAEMVTLALMDLMPGELIMLEDICFPGAHDVISGDRLLRKISPWAVQLLDPKKLKQYPISGECARGVVISALRRVANRFYSQIPSLTSHDGPEAVLLCGLVTFLSSLASCVSAIWGDTSFFDKELKTTRMYREVKAIFQDRLRDLWGQEQGEVVADIGAGFPFLAYVTTHLPFPTFQASSLTITRSKYRTKHARSYCSCYPSLKPSIQDIAAILEEDGDDIPVVYYVRATQELRVRRASQGPYVAISHVWADGVGGCPEDGVPLCQVERLAKIARRLLPDSVDYAFWQDTLCVPRDKKLRDIAIDRMAGTYKKAEKVVVLDEGIRAFCARRCDKEQCLLRIATSGWSQRIWTLQEALLSRELHFEFADGIVDCTFFNGQAYHLAQTVFPLFRYLPHDRQTHSFGTRTGEPIKLTIHDLIPLLRQRSISDLAEEPIAICSLIGDRRIDPRPLMSATTAQRRMQSFLLGVRELPRSLAMFGWSSDRLTLENFSWAPTSLSADWLPIDDDSERDGDSTVATCDNSGLSLDLHVIRLFRSVTLSAVHGLVVILPYPDRARLGGNTDDMRDSKSSSGAGPQKPHVISVVPAVHPFMADDNTLIEVNAILLRGPWLSEHLRVDHRVSLVNVLDDQVEDEIGYVGRKKAPLSCRFVSVACATSGYPDHVFTQRSKEYWAHVQGHDMGSQFVKLT